MNNHSPVVGPDGTIYVLKGVGYKNDAVYAINPDGTEKWHFSHSGMMFIQPVLSHSGTLYTTGSRKPKGSGLREGHLLAIDASTGRLKWERKLSEHAPDLWTPHIAVDSRDNVYVGAADVLYVMDAVGTKRWSYRFVIREKGGYAEYSTGPTLSHDEKTVYLLKRTGGGLMAFDSETGKVKWHDRTPYFNDIGTPTVAPDGTVYIPDEKTKSLYALSPEGKVKWKTNFPGLRLFNSNATIGKDGTIYVEAERAPSGNGGRVYALSHEDGRIKWSYEFERGTVASPMAVDGRGNIYTGIGDGYVVCLSPEGKLLWKILVGFDVPEGEERKSGDSMTQIHLSGPVISDGTIYVITGTYEDGAEVVAVGTRQE
ncbi:MAG: outer membrane protein assembly factor BamB family protein [Planctomycetota bacterium]